VPNRRVAIQHDPSMTHPIVSNQLRLLGEESGRTHTCLGDEVMMTTVRRGDCRSSLSLFSKAEHVAEYVALLLWLEVGEDEVFAADLFAGETTLLEHMS
jgi:hypothetical protein